VGIEQGRENTYQWMLRAIGAFMDDEPSCRISLVEVPDGFVVRLQRHLHKLEPIVYQFDRARLLQQLRDLGRLRPKNTNHPRHQGVWADFPNGHQDFFRALGYELDQAEARDILIDEMEDGILLTYRPANTISGHKRVVELSVAEIETILNEAFNRRRS